MSVPRAEYERRLEARRAEAGHHHQLHIRIGYSRLAAFIVLMAVAWAALYRAVITPFWLVPPIAAFAALAVWHDRVIRARDRAKRAAVFYERGIARLEDRWAGNGASGERFRDPSHPYAEDLDLFGRGSLFELLSAARTRMGEATLARWLLNPASPETVTARQSAIGELRSMLDLREELALLGEDVEAGVHPDALAAWAESQPVLPGTKIRLAAAMLSVTVIGSIILSARLEMPTPFLLAIVAVAGFGAWLRERVLQVIAGVEHALHDLELLSQVLERIEQMNFSSPGLAALRSALDSHGAPPSRRIARLRRIVELIDSRDNVAMRLIGPPLLYGTQLAFAAETWRLASGPAVRRWVEAVGEIEALSSLAGYAWEHPADPFPSVVSGPAVFEGQALGHPLLPEQRFVRNDVKLGGDLRLLIVSGSNMSGKSTLLRTVGVNAILALAGAPVRAKSLTLSPLAIGASIRVTDSLQGGTSRFYAEIKRLRQIVDLAGGGGLLFLLDELLHGTNSHDRRIGAEAVVRGLVERGAIGLITTHDLALTHIIESLRARAVNVHFEDHIENGQIHFDYRLRPGIVTKSNALELMRSVGLDV